METINVTPAMVERSARNLALAIERRAAKAAAPTAAAATLAAPTAAAATAAAPTVAAPTAAAPTAEGLKRKSPYPEPARGGALRAIDSTRLAERASASAYGSAPHAAPNSPRAAAPLVLRTEDPGVLLLAAVPQNAPCFLRHQLDAKWAPGLVLALEKVAALPAAVQLRRKDTGEPCLTALSSRRVGSKKDRASVLADLRRVLRLEPRDAERVATTLSKLHLLVAPVSELRSAQPVGDPEPKASAFLTAVSSFKNTRASSADGSIRRSGESVPQWIFGYRPGTGALGSTNERLATFEEHMSPVVKLLGELLELVHPEAHAAMMAEKAKLEEDDRFPDRFPRMPFTTIAVNLDHQSKVHRDVNDLASGMSAMIVFHPTTSCSMWASGVPGGELALPQYDLALKFGTSACSVVFFKAHELQHGNLPILLNKDDCTGSQRISLVCLCPRSVDKWQR